MNKKYNWYFTFGSNHHYIDGRSMGNHWVRVVTNKKDYNKARELFVEQFSSIYMEAPDKFAFQYEEDQFDSSFFQYGEFMVIYEPEENLKPMPAKGPFDFIDEFFEDGIDLEEKIEEEIKFKPTEDEEAWR